MIQRARRSLHHRLQRGDNIVHHLFRRASPLTTDAFLFLADYCAGNRRITLDFMSRARRPSWRPVGARGMTFRQSPPSSTLTHQHRHSRTRSTGATVTFTASFGIMPF